MILYYLLFFIIYIYLFIVNMNVYHMLQQNLYNENNRYIKWILSNKGKVLKNISVLNILLSLILGSLKNINIINIVLLIMIFIYIISLYNYKNERKSDQNKKPLVVTKRVKRLIITTSIVYFIPLFIFLINKNLLLGSLIFLTIMSYLNYFIVLIAMFINYPIERFVYHYYENKAKGKLKSMKNLKVVGITGSYGKTSCKNILADILNVKYNALATEKSFNTFYGLMITINNKLSKFDDVFIAELGAYVVGEIKGLAGLVMPKYGIITNIGTAHLESFGSQENIQKGKMELIEALPSDGVGVLNADDKLQKEYKIKNNCKILWIGIDDQDVDVCARNIKCSGKGTTFDVKFRNDDNLYEFETKLLGVHNVYNILSALALGYEFGLDVRDLQLGVKKVKPIEHRLEIKKLGDFYQIDDAYNSNPVGAKGALEILDMMDGDKVVVTPGMVELGNREDELNKIFGNQIAEVADKVILVGKNKTKPIFDGLIEKGYNKDNIYVINDVREAYTLLRKFKGKKDLYALFENDLPDMYTEK